MTIALDSLAAYHLEAEGEPRGHTCSKGNSTQPSDLEVGIDGGSESIVRPGESQDYF